MSSSPEPLAIYAAIVSTIVFVWDIIKWRRKERVRLSGRVSANMEPMGSAVTPRTKGKKYVSLHVDNRGYIPCEISHMVILIYDSWWKVIRRNPCKSAVIVDPMVEWTGKPLPFRLESGGTCPKLEADSFKRTTDRRPRRLVSPTATARICPAFNTFDATIESS